MITTRISVLLAFSLLPKESDTKPAKGSKGKKEKKGKQKNDKSSKKDKGSKKMKDEEVTIVVEKPKYLFEVGTPVGFAHMEYELIPGRPKYQIDVVCWGPVAKVFSADGDVTLRTFIQNKMAWVPVTIRHVFNRLEVADLFKLHRHVVNYTIWTSKNKMGARAKSENTKAFFIRKEDIDSPAKFTEAYIKNPNLENIEDEKDKRIEDLEKEIKNILWECADVPGAKNYNEIVTRLEFLSDPLHHFQVNKIIDRLISGKVVETKDFVPISPSPLTDEDMNKEALVRKPKKKGKDKKGQSKGGKGKDNDSAKSKKSSKSSKQSIAGGKGGKKGKQEKGAGLLKIAIPGEVFYTDPNLNIYDLRVPSADVTHAYILTTVDRLLSRLQKYLLNPMIIKIKKLSNLPVDVLAKHRFNTIHAYYSVPYIARCTTLEKPLAKIIKFNEAHAYFTDSLPKLKLLEFLQSQRLYVEIRGVRDEITKSTQANIFGCEKWDENISKKLTTRECTQTLKSNEEPTTVTLAVACYDLSSLLKPTWDFLQTASCHHPDVMGYQNVSSMYEKSHFIDAVTINEINLGVLFKTKSCSPLTESLLSDYGTSLKVEVYFSAPHSTLLEVHSQPTIYHRIFFVVNYVELASTLINSIMIHNQQVFGPDIFVVNFLKWNPTQSMLNELLKKDSQKVLDFSSYATALTGFTIDNGNSYAFFLEGLANGYILDIWGHIMESPHAVIRSFYNTDFCFEKRLYSEFLKFGGVYTINLKIPFQDIMNQYGIYLEGNVPIPAWEALKKLNLLLKCASFREMIQYCLLPTPLQLLSLDMEWGVPYKWKVRENVENTETDACPSPSIAGREERATQILCADDIPQ